MAISAREFGKAVCDHFGLPSNQVCGPFKIDADHGGFVSATLTIVLTPDDLAGIAERTKRASEPNTQQPAKAGR